ncbi:MAG: hypothetical protein Q8R28_05750 [Dehalococcoidia bacterium]|nr:hypothetical protein [Dehalococcoidia bacterium]
MATIDDAAILAALEVYDSAGDLVLATGAPLRRVIYLQRLYGSAKLQQDRADEDKALLAMARVHSSKPRTSDAGSVERKLQGPYGSYWQQFESLGQPVPRPDPAEVESMIEGLRRRRGKRVAS